MAIKSSWNKLFQFILIKISYSFITIFLIFLSVFVSLILVIVSFSLKLSADKFFINFQYYIMILYGILLFIFVLMNAIKLFGTQIEDSSFLLLLTRPYSRRTIILSQYLGLFVFSLAFIILNIIILLVFGGILGVILKITYIGFYALTVLKLFCFLILFSLLVTIGSVTLLAFNKAQNVFLIFIIFCSLFLLGGLPYSLISKETNNLQLTFQNNSVGPYSVKEIKSAILFNENYKKGLIKYRYLTKEIANFYNELSISELKNITSSTNIIKREKFFQNEGFNIPGNYTSQPMTGKVTTWNNHAKFNGKDVTIVLSFSNYFLNIEQLKQSILDNPNDIHNKAKKDLLQLYQDYDNEYKINNFMSLSKSKVPELLEYNINDSYVEESGTKTILGANDWTKAFKDSKNFVRFSGGLRNKYDALFLNPVYILLRSVEDYIYNQVLIYHSVADNEINNDENFKKYNSTINLYKTINYFNFIEHWNQLWTYLQGYYGNFWFKPLALSAIDFDGEKNPLFSYPDFELDLTSEFKINVKDTKNMQNNVIVILAYISLCLVLFGLSVFLFMRKNIS